MPSWGLAADARVCACACVRVRVCVCVWCWRPSLQRPSAAHRATAPCAGRGCAGPHSSAKMHKRRAAGEVGIRLDQVQKMLPLLDKLPERVPAEFPIHIGGMSGNVDALINLSM